MKDQMKNLNELNPLFSEHPWVVTDDDTFDIGCRAVEMNCDAPVAHVETWTDGDDETIQESKANAKLIAVAPELFFSLKQILEDTLDCRDRDGLCTPTQASVNRALKALADATDIGKPEDEVIRFDADGEAHYFKYIDPTHAYYGFDKETVAKGDSFVCHVGQMGRQPFYQELCDFLHRVYEETKS